MSDRETVTIFRKKAHKASHLKSEQSCRGCSLNRLPDVKNFIYGDLPKFSGVDFHPIPGAIPELVLFDKADKELQRIDLSSLSRDKCNELVGKWFKLKDSGSASYEIREDL